MQSYPSDDEAVTLFEALLQTAKSKAASLGTVNLAAKPSDTTASAGATPAAVLPSANMTDDEILAQTNTASLSASLYAQTDHWSAIMSTNELFAIEHNQKLGLAAALFDNLDWPTADIILKRLKRIMPSLQPRV